MIHLDFMRFWHLLRMIIMASKINISKLLSQISAFGHDANRLAVAVTNETTQGMVNQAKLRVVVDLGQLRQSIGKTTATIAINRSFFLQMLLMLLMLSSVLEEVLVFLKDSQRWQHLIRAKELK